MHAYLDWMEELDIPLRLVVTFSLLARSAVDELLGRDYKHPFLLEILLVLTEAFQW